MAPNKVIYNLTPEHKDIIQMVIRINRKEISEMNDKDLMTSLSNLYARRQGYLWTEEKAIANEGILCCLFAEILERTGHGRIVTSQLVDVWEKANLQLHINRLIAKDK